MVPIVLTPFLAEKLLAAFGKGITFAASNIGTTQMTDAAKDWWQLKSDKAMKNVAKMMMCSDSKTDSTKTAYGKSKRKEAKVRRELAFKWSKISHKVGYQKAAMKECCKRLTLQIEDEIFDGIFLNLQGKSSSRSYSKQKRIVRRIVEKRQAQLVHSKVGRTCGGFARHMCQRCTSRSMEELAACQVCR